MITVELICSIVAAVGTTLAGVWFLIRKAQKLAINDYRIGKTENELGNVENRLDSVEKNIVTITCDLKNVKSDISNVKSDINNVKSDMSDIKSDLIAIKTVLTQKFPESTMTISQKKSPRTLNDLGLKIFNEVNGSQFLQDNKDFLFKKIDSMKPKTALDVEDAARFACLGYTNEDFFNNIKLFVYNAPSMKIKDSEGKEKLYDLTLADVCYTLSLPLRDMYLEAHPEIPK